MFLKVRTMYTSFKHAMHREYFTLLKKLKIFLNFEKIIKKTYVKR